MNIKISKADWTRIGARSGWLKRAESSDHWSWGEFADMVNEAIMRGLRKMPLEGEGDKRESTDCGVADAMRLWTEDLKEAGLTGREIKVVTWWSELEEWWKCTSDKNLMDMEAELRMIKKWGGVNLPDGELKSGVLAATDRAIADLHQRYNRMLGWVSNGDRSWSMVNRPNESKWEDARMRKEFDPNSRSKRISDMVRQLGLGGAGGGGDNRIY